MQLFHIPTDNSLSLLPYQYALSPFIERFFKLGGPRGTQQKNFKIRTRCNCMAPISFHEHSIFYGHKKLRDTPTLADQQQRVPFNRCDQSTSICLLIKVLELATPIVVSISRRISSANSNSFSTAKQLQPSFKITAILGLLASTSFRQCFRSSVNQKMKLKEL